MKFSLSPNPIFWTLQGEAHLRGFQMVFIRLAGCSVGCEGCDTNYQRDSSMTAEEIADVAEAKTPAGCADRWAWITGGEPADLSQMKQRELIGAISRRGFRIAVATSGVRPFIPPVDWLSVSPHSNASLAQPYGNEIKLVFGLGSLDPLLFLSNNPGLRFMYQYVQPVSRDHKEDPQALRDCLEFLSVHPNWSLSRQDHHYWHLP